MTERELHVKLPAHIAAVVDRLAAMGSINQKEVIREAILTLIVIVENQAPSAQFIQSTRRKFGKDLIE